MEVTGADEMPKNEHRLCPKSLWETLPTEDFIGQSQRTYDHIIYLTQGRLRPKIRADYLEGLGLWSIALFV